MSVEALRWVKKADDIKAPVRSVLWVICDHASAHPSLGTGRAHVAWPGAETIARESGLGLRTVKRALRRLPEHGVMVYSRRVKTPNGACNLYEIPCTVSAGAAPSEEIEVSAKPVGGSCQIEGGFVPDLQEVSAAAAHKPKPKPIIELKIEPKDSEQAPAPEEVEGFLNDNGMGGLHKNLTGHGLGKGHSLEDLIRRVNALRDIEPSKRIRAGMIARDLWNETDGGKSVKDVMAVFMHRLQKQHIIKKGRK